MKKYIFGISMMVALSWATASMAQETTQIGEEESGADAPTHSKSYLITDNPDEIPADNADNIAPADEHADTPDELPADNAVIAAPTDEHAGTPNEIPTDNTDNIAPADEIPADNADNAAPADEIPEDNPDNAAPVDEIPTDNADNIAESGWRDGMGFYAGIGSASDLLDAANGYSARIGLDVHWKYIGIGLEVTWNMLWASDSTKRADHRDVATRTTNSGLLGMVHGYIPISNHFVATLGAGLGLGQRYELIFSDYDIKESDTSWLARLQGGVFWLFDNHLTLGLDLEFNFGGYTEPKGVWWSDKENDISLGLALTVSYQYMD